MRKLVVLGVLLLTTLQCHAQQPLEIKNFSAAQKAEWANFIRHYNGNGNGTCIPIMQEQIGKGQCTKFDFVADLHIGNNGRIGKVTVRESKILCEDRAVEKELLKCFVETLHDEHMHPPFNRLKNRIIHRVEL